MFSGGDAERELLKTDKLSRKACLDSASVVEWVYRESSDTSFHAGIQNRGEGEIVRKSRQTLVFFWVDKVLVAKLI